MLPRRQSERLKSKSPPTAPRRRQRVLVVEVPRRSPTSSARRRTVSSSPTGEESRTCPPPRTSASLGKTTCNRTLDAATTFRPPIRRDVTPFPETSESSFASSPVSTPERSDSAMEEDEWNSQATSDPPSSPFSDDCRDLFEPDIPSVPDSVTGSSDSEEVEENGGVQALGCPTSSPVVPPHSIDGHAEEEDVEDSRNDDTRSPALAPHSIDAHIDEVEKGREGERDIDHRDTAPCECDTCERHRSQSEAVSEAGAGGNSWQLQTVIQSPTGIQYGNGDEVASSENEDVRHGEQSRWRRALVSSSSASSSTLASGAALGASSSVAASSSQASLLAAVSYSDGPQEDEEEDTAPAQQAIRQPGPRWTTSSTAATLIKIETGLIDAVAISSDEDDSDDDGIEFLPSWPEEADELESDSNADTAALGSRRKGKGKARKTPAKCAPAGKGAPKATSSKAPTRKTAAEKAKQKATRETVSLAPSEEAVRRLAGKDAALAAGAPTADPPPSPSRASTQYLSLTHSSVEASLPSEVSPFDKSSTPGRTSQSSTAHTPNGSSSPDLTCPPHQTGRRPESPITPAPTPGRAPTVTNPQRTSPNARISGTSLLGIPAPSRGPASPLPTPPPSSEAARRHVPATNTPPVEGASSSSKRRRRRKSQQRGVDQVEGLAGQVAPTRALANAATPSTDVESEPEIEQGPPRKRPNTADGASSEGARGRVADPEAVFTAAPAAAQLAGTTAGPAAPLSEPEDSAGSILERLVSDLGTLRALIGRSRLVISSQGSPITETLSDPATPRSRPVPQPSTAVLPLYTPSVAHGAPATARGNQPPQPRPNPPGARVQSAPAAAPAGVLTPARTVSRPPAAARQTQPSSRGNKGKGKSREQFPPRVRSVDSPRSLAYPSTSTQASYYDNDPAPRSNVSTGASNSGPAGAAVGLVAPGSPGGGSSRARPRAKDPLFARDGYVRSFYAHSGCLLAIRDLLEYEGATPTDWERADIIIVPDDAKGDADKALNKTARRNGAIRQHAQVVTEKWVRECSRLRQVIHDRWM